MAAQMTFSRQAGAFRASKTPLNRRAAIICASASAKAAPLPSVLKAIGEEELNSKALWSRLSAPPAEFKSRSYMKNIVEHAQQKNWVNVKFDGTMFVYKLTELGQRKLAEAEADA